MYSTHTHWHTGTNRSKYSGTPSTETGDDDNVNLHTHTHTLTRRSIVIHNNIFLSYTYNIFFFVYWINQKHLIVFITVWKSEKERVEKSRASGERQTEIERLRHRTFLRYIHWIVSRVYSLAHWRHFFVCVGAFARQCRWHGFRSFARSVVRSILFVVNEWMNEGVSLYYCYTILYDIYYLVRKNWAQTL